jgi:hypothetical protein
MMHPQTMTTKKMNLNSPMMRRRPSTKGHFAKQKGRLIDSMSQISILAIRRDHSPEVAAFGRTCHQGTGMHQYQVSSHIPVFTPQTWLLQLLKIRHAHWGLRTLL